MTVAGVDLGGSKIAPARELSTGHGATRPPRALTAVGLSMVGWLSRDRREVRTAALMFTPRNRTRE